MAYIITCRTCHAERSADNIVDLIEKKTDNAFGNNGGWFRCHECGGPAHVFRESPMQEKGEEYSRYILGVVRISTWEPTYSPYIFLNASEEHGEVDHIHFNYYKDTRSTGGSLKQGHGPGGSGPVLGEKEMIGLIATLLKSGFLNKTELRECLDRTP